MLDSNDSACVDTSSDVLLTSFSNVRMMSTSRRMTTSPANAPNAAASTGNGNSVAEAPSPGDVTETVPEVMTPVDEYLILISPEDASEGKVTSTEDSCSSDALMMGVVFVTSTLPSNTQTASMTPASSFVVPVLRIVYVMSTESTSAEICDDDAPTVAVDVDSSIPI